jgi:hypothetical protein
MLEAMRSFAVDLPCITSSEWLGLSTFTLLRRLAAATADASVREVTRLARNKLVPVCVVSE